MSFVTRFFPDFLKILFSLRQRLIRVNVLMVFFFFFFLLE